MTDSNQKIPRGGLTKAGLTGIYLAISQNITPPLVAWLLTKYPVFGEAAWFQIVVAGLGGVGSLVVWITPQHFADGVKDAILFVKFTMKQWRDAWNNPN